MELRVLRYFLAVAREENITKAAALLHLTQPTLSRQLMQLEEELGVQLFQRSRYRIILTDEGMLLRRRAQELVDLAEKTEQEFRKAPELRGEISIGSGDLEGMSLLSELLVSFQKLHPQVTYRIFSGNADNTKEQLEGGMLDFGLLLEPVDISKYDFIRLPVKEQWGGSCPGRFPAGPEGGGYRPGFGVGAADFYPAGPGAERIGAVVRALWPPDPPGCNRKSAL